MAGLTGFELGLLILVATFIIASIGLALMVAVGGRRERLRVLEMLENELPKTNQALLQEQKKAHQLEEQLEEVRPEHLMGRLEQATEELENLHHRLSECERQTGYMTQELLQESKQHEQMRARLEQERQHLMEEVERWRKRYVESQEQVKRLEQERSDAQHKVEQLTQLREKLLEDIGEIGDK
jgi:chromosome segregation ATPase